MITIKDLRNNQYTEEELEKHINGNDFTDEHWYYISYNQVLSEPFIERYKNNVDWYYISYNQVLSEPFIERHKNNVDWDWISRDQTLSESFIEKHKNNVVWYNVSRHQILSENFLLNNLEYIDIDCLEENKHVPKELLEKVKFMKELSK
jgi:hypothetical protein